MTAAALATAELIAAKRLAGYGQEAGVMTFDPIRPKPSSTSRTSRCATACMPSAIMYGLDHVKAIAKALDEAGVDAIEVAHGDGLNGASFNYGFGAHTDWEWIEAVAEVVKKATLTTLLLPGIGTVDELRAPMISACARSASPPIAPRPTSPSSISGGARSRHGRVGFLMMSHMIEPERWPSRRKLMESYGAMRLCHDSAARWTWTASRAAGGL
jgi:4-hydroxy 2-oxovalerate aldolase